MATVVNYYTANGRIIAEEQVGGYGYRNYGPDALGSVAAVYGPNGLLQNSYRYSPYGNTIVSQVTESTPYFIWCGTLGYRQTSYHLPEFYVRARHYSSALARWTTVDPLWPQERAYGYVGGPATYTDGTGTATIQPCLPASTGPRPAGVSCTWLHQVQPSAGAGTVCNFQAALPYTCMCTTQCFAPCVLKHEAVQRQNIASCCANAGTCYNNAIKQKNNSLASECMRLFNAWGGANVETFECKAGSVSMQCLAEYIDNPKNGCHGTDQSACCQLYEWQYATQDCIYHGKRCSGGNRQVFHCPGDPVTNCPIDSSGKITRVSPS